MRGLTDREALARFMRALGNAATADAPVYFTGGSRPERLRELFAATEPEMYRYPAIDPRSFRAAVDAVTQ